MGKKEKDGFEDSINADTIKISDVQKLEKTQSKQTNNRDLFKNRSKYE